MAAGTACKAGQRTTNLPLFTNRSIPFEEAAPMTYNPLRILVIGAHPDDCEGKAGAAKMEARRRDVSLGE